MKSLATLIGILWIGLGLAFLPESQNQSSNSNQSTTEPPPEKSTVAKGGDDNDKPEEKAEFEELTEPSPADEPTNGLAGIIKLKDSGVSNSVLSSFAKNTEYDAPLNAGDILYLNEMGISEEVITLAMDTAKSQHKILSELEDISQPIPQNTNPEIVQKTNSADIVKTDVAPSEHSGSVQNVESVQEVTQTATEIIVEDNTTNHFQESGESYAVVHATPETVVEEVIVEEPVYTENERVTVWRDELSPHGEWIQTAEYGLCWRPHLVRADNHWRPYYTSGRWIYSDLGWYWKSGYAWGHVVFHHGRWWRHRSHGWLWYPDVVWAPSWVSFRSFDAYCGWAPLPPRAVFRRGHGFFYRGRHVGVGFGFGLGSSDFIFVSYNRFTDPYFHRHRLHGPAYYHAYHHSTVINNYNVHVDNVTVINNGVPVAEVEGKGRTKVERVAIRKSTDKLRKEKRDVIDRTGKVPTIYREDRERIIAKAQRKTPTLARSLNSGPGRIPTTSSSGRTSLASGQELGTTGIINRSSSNKGPSNPSQAKRVSSRPETRSNKNGNSVARSSSGSMLPGARSSVSKDSSATNSSKTVLGTKKIYTPGSNSASRSVTSYLPSNKRVGTRTTTSTPRTIPSSRIWSSPSRQNGTTSNISRSSSNSNSSRFTPTPRQKNTVSSTQRNYSSSKTTSPRVISNVQSSPSRVTSQSRTPVRTINRGSTLPSIRSSSPTFRSRSSSQTRPSTRSSSPRSSSVRSLPSTSVRSTPSARTPVRSAPTIRSSSSSSSSSRSTPRVISGTTSSSRSSSLPTKP